MFLLLFQSLCLVQLFATPWSAACQASLSFTISRSLLKLMSIESVMPSNYLIFCCPLLLLLSMFPNIRVFFNESTLPIRWPKYWSFSFSISLSNEYSGLVSFRIDWFDLLAVQGTLKSLLQHHSLKASVLWHSVFFMAQLSPSIHDYWLYRPLSTKWCLCFLICCLGHDNPLQNSCLESSMDRVWEATVHRVTKSWTRLSTHVLMRQQQLWELTRDCPRNFQGTKVF